MSVGPRSYRITCYDLCRVGRVAAGIEDEQHNDGELADPLPPGEPHPRRPRRDMQDRGKCYIILYNVYYVIINQLNYSY